MHYTWIINTIITKKWHFPQDYYHTLRASATAPTKEAHIRAKLPAHTHSLNDERSERLVSIFSSLRGKVERLRLARQQYHES